LPYQPRKSFEDLSLEILTNVRKISLFLKKYPHIKCDDFFRAPIEIHSDEKYPSLKFFTSFAAIKNYTLFKKKQDDEDPEKQFERIKESFRYIGMFCLENKISLKKYSTHKTGYILSWLDHYREHKINPYSLMEMPGIFDILNTLPSDEVEIFAKDLKEKLVAYKTRYIGSNSTKKLVKEATKKIENFLIKNLQTNSSVLL
jgi:hypothetical protein